MWNDFKSRSGRLLREQLVEGVNVYIGSILMMSGCLLSMRLIDPANVGYKVVVLSYLFAILVNQLAARYLYFCSVIKHRMPGGTH